MNRWIDHGLVVLDTETTGLDPRGHRVVEIALVSIDRGVIDAEGAESRLVNPGLPIPPDATAIHGIGDADVAEAPSFGWLLRSISDRIYARVPVAYSHAFDRAMVAAEWLRADPYGPMPAQLHPASRWLDPLVWIREKDRFVKGKGRHRLAATCERWGVPLPQAHRAKGDALACAGLLLELSRRGVIPPDLDEALGQQYALAMEQDRRHREWIASQPRTALESAEAANG